MQSDRLKGALYGFGEHVASIGLWLAAAALLIIVVLNGVNIVLRYFFLDSLSWAEEAMDYLMVFSVYTGAISVAWRQAHIRIDAFLNYAPLRYRRAMNVASTLVMVAILVPVTIASFSVVVQLFQFDQRSDAMKDSNVDSTRDRSTRLVTDHRDVAAAHLVLRTGAGQPRSAACRRGQALMAALVLVVLPVVLLCCGVPIFVDARRRRVDRHSRRCDIGTMEPMHSALFGGLDNFPLLAVPLFIFAGEIMGRGGIARRMVEWVLAVIGGIRGSLALATIASSELFGSMSGSSVGCVAAIGRLMIPELTRRGYSKVFSGSLIASCGAIATIIPPSITMIIYGVAAQQSVPQLFLAGIVPGILIGVLVSVYLLIYANVTLVPLTDPLRWRTLVSATREAIWALLAPVVILGGIYGGLFTPTEAAGIACIYAIAVSIFIYRAMTWAQLWQTAINSARSPPRS